MPAALIADELASSCAVYREKVYRIALRVLGNHFEAEDITQQVFLNILAKPHAFRGGNFSAWIAVVARNYSISTLRHHQPVLLGSVPPDALSTGATQPLEDEVIMREAAVEVCRAMAVLKSSERSLIAAAFLDEESREQIARVTGLPLGTVKTRIRAGLRRMRSTMPRSGERL